MTGVNPNPDFLRDHRQYTLPVKIAGIVFWGMVLVGIGVSFMLLRGQEHEIRLRYAARADHFAYTLQQYLLRTPQPSLPQLKIQAENLVHETGVSGVDIRIGSQNLRIGDTGSTLSMLPRLVQYTAGDTAGRPATAFAAIYNPSVADAVAAVRKNVLLVMGTILLAFGLILQWILRRVLSQPFERMLDVALAFSHGETTLRFAEKGNDEFGFLAKFINKALDFSTAQQQALRDALVRVQRSESALFAEKERAEVTLHSIGDAVITTDARASVEYMNPVAEALTGWPSKEALGRPLAEVLNLVDENSREPVENPVEGCLRNGGVIGRMDHVVMLCPDGRELDIAPSAAPIHDRNGGLVGAIMVFDDVGNVRRVARQLSYQASHDPLTGLNNRREFERQLQLTLDEVRLEGRGHVLCFLDMDQFKVVNDTCGHAAGDELLKRISAMLRETARESDVIARLGGDEFGILLKHCDVDHAIRIAEDLLDKTRNFRFVWQDHSFDVGVSIGIVSISSTATTLADVMAAADIACYAAKDAGRNRIHAYRPDDNLLRQRHGEMRWVSRLERAMEQNCFRLYCQPVVSVIRDGEPAGYYEILLRLVDDNGALIPPVAFLAAAERYNLMPQIDRWVIRAALGLLRTANTGQRTLFAINLSGRSLCDDGFLDFVINQFNITGVSPDLICFEIKESTAIANLDKTLRLVRALRGLGCSFALDNFGSGLSSFAYLKNLTMDYVKIDGDFVKDVAHDPFNRSMVEAANLISHMAGIRTIAEFTESQTTMVTLERIGVDYAQGYAIAKPCPIEDILNEFVGNPERNIQTM
ncbi:MAG: EAL domain-containing protein [Acidiferrobacterales bacterium]